MRLVGVGSVALAVVVAAAVTYPLWEREQGAPALKPSVPVVQQSAPVVQETAPVAEQSAPEPAVARLELPLPREDEFTARVPEPADVTGSLPPKDQARVEQAYAPLVNRTPEAGSQYGKLSYLADYAYSETIPDTKPADVVLATLKDVPVGTPIEEIKRASDAFGLDVMFMKAVAKIESDFDPKQKTGSYIGLFQLSHYKFDKFGSGEITDARDNAIAAAYKFATAAILFEVDTHKKATLNDLYLIHQQGWQGAAEHVAHPARIAWKSMCATDEGREKGEKWCKRAVWANTLPAIKEAWKSVDNLTSGAFVEMWRARIDKFYARYSEAAAK